MASKPKRKMRPGGGAAKGFAFEREISRELSMYITRRARDDVLWRTSMSGGRATVQRRKNAHRRNYMAQAAGDLAATHPMAEKFCSFWYVECKRYKKWDWHRLLDEHAGKLHDFWQTTCDEAGGVHKTPMLVFKENGGSILVGVTKVGWSVLKRDSAMDGRIPLLSFVVYLPNGRSMFIFKIDQLQHAARLWMNN